MNTVLVAQQPSSTAPVDHWLAEAAPDVDIVLFTEAGGKRKSEDYGPRARVVRTDVPYFSPEATGQLLSLCEEVRPDRLVSNAELDMVRVATARSLFGIPGFGATLGHRLRDKLAMKALFAKAGLPAVPHVDAQCVDDLHDALASFGKIVVKPRWGVGSQGVRVFNDSRQLLSALIDDATFLPALTGHQLIAEAFAPGAVLHIDAVLDGENVLFCAASEYVDPPHLFGTRDTCSVVQDPDGPSGRWALEACRAFARSLPADHGVSVIHFEAYRDGEGFLAGEVAGRLGGGAIKNLLKIAYGVDLSREGYLVAAGLAEGSSLAQEPLPPLAQPAGMVLWTSTDPRFGPEDAPAWTCGTWRSTRAATASNSVDSRGGTIVLGANPEEVLARVRSITGRA